jgi:hypothetical protein
MKRAARFLWLAQQLRGEADRWIKPDVVERLKQGSTQLHYAVSAAYSLDPQREAECDALEEAAINMLVRLMTARASRELAEGVTP